MPASQSTTTIAVQELQSCAAIGTETRHVILWTCSKDRKLLKTLKFPKEYDLKVTLKAVNWEVMKSWIAKRVTELLGLEDEVVIGYIYEQLEGKDVRCRDVLVGAMRGPPCSELVLLVSRPEHVPMPADD